MGIPNPNYPMIKDQEKTDNSTYSSNKIEALIQEATELPTPAAGDAGKVLTVNAAETGYKLDTPVSIDDTAASDTTTYSSNKIEDLANPKYTLIHEETLDTATTEIEIPDIDARSLFIVVSNIIYDASTTITIYSSIKSDSNSTYFRTPMRFSITANANTAYTSLNKVYLDGGFLFGYGSIYSNNSYTGDGKYFSDDYLANIAVNSIKALKINTNTNLPVGTVVKVYAY